jgi:hypothetical protein
MLVAAAAIGLRGVARHDEAISGGRRLHSGTARDEAKATHQGVFSVGERGHRLTERRPPFLGEASISGQGRQPAHLNAFEISALLQSLT